MGDVDTKKRVDATDVFSSAKAAPKSHDQKRDAGPPKDDGHFMGIDQSDHQTVWHDHQYTQSGDQKAFQLRAHDPVNHSRAHNSASIRPTNRIINRIVLRRFMTAL